MTSIGLSTLKPSASFFTRDKLSNVTRTTSDRFEWSTVRRLLGVAGLDGLQVFWGGSEATQESNAKYQNQNEYP